MVMDYAELKWLHVGCVVISFCLFFLRGLWMLSQSPLLWQRSTRVVPHLIDTVLLVSAIALALTTHQYPLENNWLTAKVAGLMLYIGLGTLAFRHGSAKGRLIAWVAAQGVFVYIVGVAITRNSTWLLG
jgi:uncharacterized membrane protein SirB2